MGTWGTGISSNDTYGDIYDDFMDMYNEGTEVSDITAKLINENQETIDLIEDAPNFWFALANAQWECCALEDTVLKKVEDLIVSGQDLRIWKELDASDADIKARAKVLTKFLEKISVPKTKPKKRVKKILINSIFEQGDCLTYIMDNGNYGGALVIASQNNTQFGLNYLAILTINQPSKPSLSDFSKSEIYTIQENNIGKTNTFQYPHVGMFLAKEYDNNKIEIKVVGNLVFYKPVKVVMIVGDKWLNLKTIVTVKEQFLSDNQLQRKTLKTTDLIGELSWFQKLCGK